MVFLRLLGQSDDAAAAEELEVPAAGDDGELPDGEAAAGEDGGPGGAAAFAEVPPALPVFKPDYVFATHERAFQYNPQPNPTWTRMHVCGGPVIGSTLTAERFVERKSVVRGEAPIWFVPTLPFAIVLCSLSHGWTYLT